MTKDKFVWKKGDIEILKIPKNKELEKKILKEQEDNKRKG